MNVLKFQTGELIDLCPELARAESGVGVVVRPPQMDVPTNAALHEAAILSNVIPFRRPRIEDTAPAAPQVTLHSDVARLPAVRLAGERMRMLALVTLSLAVHAGVFLYYFMREPTPLASIGVEVISAEIVVGATTPAGISQTQGENQVDSAESKADPSMAEVPQEQLTTLQEQSVQVASHETAPPQTVDEKVVERRPDETAPKTEAVAPPEPQEPAKQMPAVAMVESPTPDMATAAPKEIPPDTTEVSLLPQPEEKTETPAEPKPVAKPQARPDATAKPNPTKTAAKPVKDAAPAKERRRIEAPTGEKASKQAKQSTFQTASSGFGIGRSDNDTNYRGMVAAHLARHKQYPSDARSRGDQGTAAVTFGLDGGGRVTSVRLARGSGHGSLDQEVQAMVRRASPFPAPPSGRGVSFTVPVSFRVN